MTPRVDFVKNPLDIEELRPAWDSLLERAPKGPPFSAWAWIIPWSLRLGRGALTVMTAHANHRLIGVLPLIARRRVNVPLLTYSLAASGEDGLSDERDLLAEAGREAEVAELFASALAQDKRWDRLLLGDLPDPGAAAQSLARHLGQPLAIEAERCPVIRFGPSFEQYLGGCAREVVGQAQKKRRWFEKAKGFSWRRLTTPDELKEGVGALFYLHERSFLRKSEPSRFIGDPVHRAFQSEAAVEMARSGLARLYLLEAEGAPRAALYGFERAARFYFYQVGFDPSFQNRSPGSVGLLMALEDCYQRGIEEFDFLRGQQPYKLAWTNGERRTITLSLERFRPLPKAFAFAEAAKRLAKVAAKRFLPPKTLELLRSTLRSAPPST